VLLPGMVAPVREMVLPPVIVSVPPHGELVEFGTARPDGRVSVKPTPVSVTVPVLAMVIFSVVIPFKGTLAAPNDLLMTGATACADKAHELASNMT
jgi:hypothetical protein